MDPAPRRISDSRDARNRVKTESPFDRRPFIDTLERWRW
jgi:hypothetical protein